MGDAGELRVPDYFPRAHAECKSVAEAFFDCFSCESAQPLGSKTYASRKCVDAKEGSSKVRAYLPLCSGEQTK